MSSRQPLLFALALLALAAGGALFFVSRAPASAPTAGPTAGPGVGVGREDDGAAAELTAPGAATGERAAPSEVLAAGLAPDATGVRAAGDGRLEGVVLARGSGAAVGGARVELHAVLPMGAPLVRQVLPLFGGLAEAYVGNGEPLAVTEADALGRFVFEGVRRGVWYVQARGEREAPDGVVQVAVARSGAGGPVEVFVRPGGRVLGRVLGPEGAPATGARIVLVSGLEQLLESVRAGDLCALETEADSEGHFALLGVPPGEAYDLFALPRGMAIAFESGLAVRAGADTEVTLQVDRGATVVGRVVARDPAAPGEPPVPVAGAHLAAVPRGLRYLAFAGAVLATTHAESDAEGGFELRHVPAGEVDLVGIAAGHPPAIGPAVITASGARAEAPDFVFEGGPVVSGRVVDGEGRPLPGVRVTWEPIDLDRLGFAGAFGGLAARAMQGLDYPVTGVDGRFTAGAFAGEPDYWIEFQRAGYATERHGWDPAEEDELEIVLSPGGYVEGIVMDIESTEPVSHFTVQADALIQAGGELVDGGRGVSPGRLFEDPGGRFRMGPLAPGSATLEFDAPGYALTRVHGVQVDAGETTRGVIVELSGGARVLGRVVDADGAPVAGATVVPKYERTSWIDPQSQEIEAPVQEQGVPQHEFPTGLASYVAGLGLAGRNTARTGGDGRFELTGMEAGTLRLAAVHRAHATGWSEPVAIDPAAVPAEVVIEVSPGGAIQGRVADRHDRPVPGAMVIAMAPQSIDSDDGGEGDALCQGRTDLEGRYRIERVGAGTYFMVLARGDAALDPMRLFGTLNFDVVTVPRGAEVEYDIVDLSVGGTRVFGHVLTRGEPVSGGQITAMGLDTESLLGFDVKLASIRADGSYEFESLAPGEFQLGVESETLAGQARLVIDVPDVPEYRLDLALPEGRIAGRAVDARTGELLPGIAISARSSLALEPGGLLGGMFGRQAGAATDWTDDEGAFSFDRLEEAEYELTIRTWGGSGRYVLNEPLVVALGRNETRDGLLLRLEPALELAGTVRDVDGRAVGEARVTAHVEGRPDTLISASTDEDGRFTLRGVGPDPYVVRAAHAGYAAARLVDVRAEAAGEALEVTLEPGIRVTALVLGNRGQAVAGAAARLFPADAGGPADPGELEGLFEGMIQGDGLSGVDGRLELGHFGPGDYVLEAQRGADRGREPVTLVAGSAPVEVTVRLR